MEAEAQAMINTDAPLTIDMKHYPDVVAHREAVLPFLQQFKTPLFLCQQDNIVSRFSDLQAALQTHWGPYVISYSFKTNYQVARTGILQSLGAWAEVVSAREYQMARNLEYPGRQIIYNGPYKPDDSLRSALKDQAVVNLNDHDELDRLLKIVEQLDGDCFDVGIRVSSTLPRVGHSRFGYSLENSEASDAVRRIIGHARVRLVGVHTHVYGDTDDPMIYECAAHRLGSFAREYVLDHGITLKYIDMGGGFPAHSPKPKSRTTWDPQPIEVYVRGITRSLREFFPLGDEGPTLLVEPGRYLVGDAIVLVTRVVHVKTRDDGQVVNCDGSISMVPLTHYSPQIIRAYTPRLEPSKAPLVQTSLHGCTCRENDQLFEGMLPRVSSGDLIIHYAAGAYNANLSPDFIFASPDMRVF